MKIVNEYRIKPGTTMQDIENEIRSLHMPWKGTSTYIHPAAEHTTFKELLNDITVNIAFPKKLSDWNSYDYVLIMDEVCGQPYYPFYETDEKKFFPFVLSVVGIYNKLMDSFSFLEKETDERNL